MMGPTRMIFLAAILFTWGTVKAMELNSLIPNFAEDVENPPVLLKKILPFINAKEFNSSMIIPKEFKDGENIHPVAKSLPVLGCGSYILDPGTTVIIRSENYPNNLPFWHSCQWDFQASSSESKMWMFCPVFRLSWWWVSYVYIGGGDFHTAYWWKHDCLAASSTTNSLTVFLSTTWAYSEGFECYVTASEKCGTVNRAIRIIGGVETEVNEYPWQVALVVTGTNIVFCGGSVYNDRYIITAGHCAQAIIDYGDIGIVEVLLGAHDLDNQQASVQRISVEQVIVHENYDSSNYNNDIGLLKLSSAATLNDQVKPACLPNPPNDYDNVNAIVSGWGTTSEGGSLSSVLLEVEVPTMSNSACQASYGSFITDNMICAGLAVGGKDSCQGDSGGPLATLENGKWTLIGVVSWGNGCARPNFPGVYVRVSKYLSWLGSHTVGSSTCP